MYTKVYISNVSLGNKLAAKLCYNCPNQCSPITITINPNTLQLGLIIVRYFPKRQSTVINSVY